MSTNTPTLPRTASFTAAQIKSLVLGTLDRVAIEDANVAQLIAILDKEENLMHVQFTDLESGKPLSNPIIWNIKDWHNHYDVYVAKKKRAAEERLVENINSENITRAAKVWMKKYHLTQEAAYEVAALMVKKQKDYALLEAIGVYVEQPPRKKE